MTLPWIDDERDASDDEPASSPPVVGLHTVPADRTPTELANLVTALEGRLSSLPVIEQAKGALMITYGLTADAAFDVLLSHSQSTNIKVRDIAAGLISNAGNRAFVGRAPAEPGRLLDTVTDGLREPPQPRPATRLSSDSLVRRPVDILS